MHKTYSPFDFYKYSENLKNTVFEKNNSRCILLYDVYWNLTINFYILGSLLQMLAIWSLCKIYFLKCERMHGMIKIVHITNCVRLNTFMIFFIIRKEVFFYMYRYWLWIYWNASCKQSKYLLFYLCMTLIFLVLGRYICQCWFDWFLVF